MKKTPTKILIEMAHAPTTKRKYDIFLSHAFRDAKAILGIKGLLEDVGYSVYVDWIDDPQLDRTQVTPGTAEHLRTRMNMSRSLFYATTENASESKWMPWECGYFDGKKGKTAILPITQTAESQFQGQEYLSLYPYILKAPRQVGGKLGLLVYREPKVYIDFDSWLAGQEPTRRQ